MKKSIKKKIYQFPVVVHEDISGGYWVECPTLKGCYSQGDTIDEALENVREAISLCLEDIPKKELPAKTQGNISLHFVTV